MLRTKSQIEQRSIVTYYIIFQTCFNLLIFIPIFYQMQKIAGLNNNQIYSIQSIYYFLFLLFELPTGFLADLVGHKKVLILSSSILTLANIFPIIMPNIQGFLLLFILIALARSLYSGSSSAYLYIFLQKFNNEKKYKQIEGKARSYTLIARCLAWPLSGYLLTLNYNFPFYITIFFNIISLTAVMFMPSIKNIKNTKRIGSSFKNYLEFCTAIIKNKKIILIMTQGIGLFILQRIALLQLFQPLLLQKEFKVEMFGIFLSLATAFEALASRQAYRLKSLSKSDFNTVSSLTLVLSILFALFAVLPSYCTIVVLVLFSTTCGLIFPIHKQLINDNISQNYYLKNNRASVLSVESILQRLTSAIFTMVIALFLNLKEISLLFISSSSVIIVVIILVFKKNYLLSQEEDSNDEEYI